MGLKSRVIPYGGAVRGTLHQLITDSYWGTVITDSTSVNDNVSNFSSFNGSQITDSKGNRGYRNLRRGGDNGDVGGPFTTTKKWVDTNDVDPHSLHGEVLDKQNFRRYETSYLGPLLPMAPNLMAFPSSAYSSDHDLNELGTVAISRCSPSNPTADTSVFLKETLSEGIPHLFIDNLRRLRDGSMSRRRSLADAYLNLEFGWLPFVSDFQQSVEAILKADDIMRQYERDSGKLVRRSYYFPVVEETTSNEVRSNVSPWLSPLSSGLTENTLLNKGRVIRTERTWQQTWFKGAFQYYVPSDYRFTSRDGIANAVIRARKVNGLALTPDVVWNSMPWSWMVDWFSNTSEVLQNLSDWAIDNQVMRYGYIMQHTLREWTYTFVGETGFRSRNVVVPPVKLVTETKVRRQATPYGFGFDFGSISNRQKAILAALGLSRGK